MALPPKLSFLGQAAPSGYVPGVGRGCERKEWYKEHVWKEYYYGKEFGKDFQVGIESPMQHCIFSFFFPFSFFFSSFLLFLKLPHVIFPLSIAILQSYRIYYSIRYWTRSRWARCTVSLMCMHMHVYVNMYAYVPLGECGTTCEW